MYNYFDSKEELITEIMNNGIEKLTRFFDPNHDGILTSNEMEYLIHETINQIKQHIDYWKLYSSAALQTSVFDKIQKKLGKMVPQYTKMLTTYFNEQGMDNPLGEAILFGALLDGIGFNYIMSPDTYPIDDIEKLLVERYCGGKRKISQKP